MDLKAIDYLEFFTTPFNIPEDIEKTTKLTYKHVIVVMRGQPLHGGHVFLLKYACMLSAKVTIGIGSANIINEDNPFTASQRNYMLDKAIVREGLDSQIKSILYLDDNPIDSEWIKGILEQAPIPIEAVIGNNEWVNSCFRSVGIEAIKAPLLMRGIYEGKKIRAFLRQIGEI